MATMNETWVRLLRVDRYPQYAQLMWWGLRGRRLLRRHRVTAGQNIEFHGLPILQSAEVGSICLGSGITLCSDSAYTALGVSRPVILRTLLPGARLSIGDDCGLSGTVICAAQSITIGRRCLFGADVMVVDTDFHPVAPVHDRRNALLERAARAPVVVGDDVFIGARCIILKGVTIGAGAVVGAGSVVVSDIPANTVAAGSPARVLCASKNEVNEAAIETWPL
jgi:acetyltransferase-like isoleucine patch superfamily enzyme